MRRFSDRLAQSWLFLSAVLIIVLLVLFFILLGNQSSSSIVHFGWKFVFSRVWDPVHQIFGGLPFLYGTTMTSLFAIICGGIVGIASALFLVYFSSGRLRGILGLLIELLAAIPSVVYGLWGLFVLAPWLQHTGEPFLAKVLGFLPLFKGMPLGVGYLAAGIILSVMIIPTITSIARDVLLAVPKELLEGALALGATRYELLRLIAIPYARSGIIGALMLGLGRAFGETIAVTMVIGNSPQISSSLFAPGYTMASVIANEFTEATTHLYLSSLYEVGLVLLVTTIIFYAVARLFIWQVTNSREGTTV